MKKTITLLQLLFISGAAFSQSPITLTATDLPYNNNTYTLSDLMPAFPAIPANGTNQSWNYSTKAGTPIQGFKYSAEIDPFFLNAGVDAYIFYQKAFNKDFFYDNANEYDFSSAGIYDKGVYTPKQGYDLASFTGKNTDSLLIPEQSRLFTTPRTIIKFPFTVGSAAHNITKASTNFFLHVPAFGLNRAPSKHSFTLHRNDTVVGWGKMSVHTPNGPTIYYDVLMQKVESYAIDSFYVNGQPASSQLLGAFQCTQGQKTNGFYAYNFYRASSPGFVYLLRAVYTDNTFSTLSGMYINNDNHTLTGLKDEPVNEYTTVLFPNPATGNELKLLLSGAGFANARYTITNETGQIADAGNKDLRSGEYTSFDISKLRAGLYILRIEDSRGRLIASESFTSKH